MKIVKYGNMNFQRNGVAGEPFYSLTIQTRESKNKLDNYLITFNTFENDMAIIPSSCRVINLNNLTESYRGDEFAHALNDMFNDLRNGFHLKTDTIYDFCLMNKNYEKEIA